jgi:hypothetical protein
LSWCKQGKLPGRLLSFSKPLLGKHFLSALFNFKPLDRLEAVPRDRETVPNLLSKQHFGWGQVERRPRSVAKHQQARTRTFRIQLSCLKNERRPDDLLHLLDSFFSHPI